MATSEWDIYASELSYHGLGYALWTPGPSAGVGRVGVGDVGWIDHGAFVPLFNTLREAGDDQPFSDTPLGHVALAADKAALEGPHETIRSVALFGHALRREDDRREDCTGSLVPGCVRMNMIASYRTAEARRSARAVATLRFQCMRSYGAFLLLEPHGVSHMLTSRGVISRYMCDHFDKWLDFANAKSRIALNQEQLLFVCGTTKTSHWAMAAFHGDLRDKFGSVSTKPGSLGSFGFTVEMEDASYQSVHSRQGPRRIPAPIRRDQSAVIQADDGEGHCDQCIFLHYYHMKRRTRHNDDQELDWYPWYRAPADARDEVEEGVDGIGSPVTQVGTSHGTLCTERTCLQLNDASNAILDYILEVRQRYAELAKRDELNLYNLWCCRTRMLDMRWHLIWTCTRSTRYVSRRSFRTSRLILVAVDIPRCDRRHRNAAHYA